MKYMISQSARDTVVGLLDQESAEEDINLAHNLFDSHVNYNYYNGVVNFNSVKKFYRFLINKYFLRYWDAGKTFAQNLKYATNKARRTIEEECEFNNFMVEIYHRELAQIHKYEVRLNNK